MPTTDPAELSILAALDAALRAPRSAAILAKVADEVSAELARNPDARLAWRPIPLSTYDRLPDAIASSWIFVLRAHCTSGAERHPNSIQRFMSYRGAADMQTWLPANAAPPGPETPVSGRRPSTVDRRRLSNDGAWASNHLVSDPHAPLDRRWLSIPINVWHRPVMGAEDWIVVSFHTAADDQLIEERPADDANPDAGLLSSGPYAGRKAR